MVLPRQSPPGLASESLRPNAPCTSSDDLCTTATGLGPRPISTELGNHTGDVRWSGVSALPSSPHVQNEIRALHIDLYICTASRPNPRARRCVPPSCTRNERCDRRAETTPGGSAAWPTGHGQASSPRSLNFPRIPLGIKSAYLALSLRCQESLDTSSRAM